MADALRTLHQDNNARKGRCLEEVEVGLVEGAGVVRVGSVEVAPGVVGVVAVKGVAKEAAEAEAVAMAMAAAEVSVEVLPGVVAARHQIPC